MTDLPHGISLQGKSEKLSIKLRNPEGNPCYFGFVISLDETGEKLCETKLVAPNHEIKQVTITHALEKGTYPATISISTYELETGAPMNGAEMKINIIVS